MTTSGVMCVSRAASAVGPTTEAFSERVESRPWFEAGQALDGESMAARLRAQHARDDPYCVYVHIPFCEKICTFCALYTKAVPAHRGDVFDAYLGALIASLQSHPWRSRPRAPTTVHFGGGTPLQPGLDRFARLVDALRATFGDDARCEWALEATTSSIDRESCARLRELGITRVHLGVQTLDDEIRRAVGRRESGAAVLAKIELLRRHGFHVSIDLILGLGQYRERVLVQDLRALYAANVRMFSICELRLRKPRQEPVEGQYESTRNYRYWQIIWSFMQARGLVPIHLGQFARVQEDNLYFTHPARNEDCIAVGAYAHGSAGNLYYQNKLLGGFLAAVAEGRTVVDHGVAYDAALGRFRQVEKELLAQRLSASSLAAVTQAGASSVGTLVADWTAAGLLIENGAGWDLTCSGSWYVGNMIAVLREVASPSRAFERIDASTRVRQHAAF